MQQSTTIESLLKQHGYLVSPDPGTHANNPISMQNLLLASSKRTFEEAMRETVLNQVTELKSIILTAFIKERNRGLLRLLDIEPPVQQQDSSMLLTVKELDFIVATYKLPSNLLSAVNQYKNTLTSSTTTTTTTTTTKKRSTKTCMYFGNTDLSSGKVELTKFLDIVLPPERVVERKRAFHFIVATHTINQFFGSEQSATQFMSNVAALLTEDGLFIALFESPTERIAQYESSREFKRARKLKPTQVYAAFGAVLPGSDEYLLFVKSLVDIADKVGLEPRVHYPESLATLFKHEDLYRNVKNFNDSIVCVVFHRRKEQYRHHHHQ